jgi:GST-like protein
MITLYGARGSGSASVEAALVLAGLEHHIVEGATWEPGPGYDELRKVNPLGQVPTIVFPDGVFPDGGVMSESAAILTELGLRYPDSGLLPRDPALRARSIRGLVYIAANCYAAIGVYDYPERWCEGCDEATRGQIQAGTRARLHRLWEIFADMVPPSPWLSGPEMGALDLMASVVSRWSGSRAHLAQARPALSALLQRIDTEPRVAGVFRKHWPG